MNPLSLHWPQSASALLEEARQGVDLVRLIMDGTQHLESWMIENRILPAIQEHEPGLLRFTVNDREKRTASLLPLPDGSAFACTTEGLWLALNSDEALYEIEHIGSRFSPGDRWLPGFAADVQWGAEAAAEIRPVEVAGIWEKLTGVRPRGFEAGKLDKMEAYGFGVIDKVLHIQDRLGL